jgi:hypothetical protein
MLEFNHQGFLIPASMIKSNIDEFKAHFVIDSPENIRKNLYDQYKNYTDDLKAVCGEIELVQWLDGSFVTKKPKPSDIDLVTFIDIKIVETTEKELRKFIYPASLENYGIDGYIVIFYPRDHKHHSLYKSDCAYWIDHFGKTKPSRRYKRTPKGFLEIIV